MTLVASNSDVVNHSDQICFHILCISHSGTSNIVHVDEGTEIVVNLDGIDNHIFSLSNSHIRTLREHVVIWSDVFYIYLNDFLCFNCHICMFILVLVLNNQNWPSMTPLLFLYNVNNIVYHVP